MHRSVYYLILMRTHSSAAHKNAYSYARHSAVAPPYHKSTCLIYSCVIDFFFVFSIYDILFPTKNTYNSF